MKSNSLLPKNSASLRQVHGRLRRLLWLDVELLLFVIGWGFDHSASAASITWTNTAGGAWSVAANWSPHLVPGSSDNVSITTAGTYKVAMDVSPIISSLTLGGASGEQTLTNSSQTLTVSHASVVNANGVMGMNNGILNGAGSFGISGLVYWNGGNTGPGSTLTVLAGGVLNLQGGLVVFQGPVTNNGTVNWLGGGVAINTGSGYSGVFWNQPGGVFDIQCSQQLYYGVALPTFHNAGLIRKEIDGGITSFGVFLNNSGTVQAKAGTLNIPNGCDLGGTFQADAGAAINFNAGNYTLGSPPANFQGPGTVQFTGVKLTLTNFVGSYTLNSPTVVAGTNTIAGTGAVTLNGVNSDVGAALTILSGGVLNLSNTVVFQGPVTNNGTVNWLGGGVAINTGSGYSGVFWNQPGGVFDIQCSQQLYYGVALPTFHNAGLIRKEIDGGITSFGVFLNNSGTVQAKAGTLNIPNGCDLGGTFQADAGAAINFNAGNYTLGSPPANFQGPGTVQFTGVKLTLTNFVGSYTLNSPTVVAGTNTIAGTGAVTLNGVNSDVGAALTILSGGVLNLSNTVVFQGPVTNNGTVNWLGGGVAINTGSGYSGVFWNQPGGVFDIQCSQQLYYGVALPTFHNAGLIRKEIDGGTTSITVALDNTGIIKAQTGIMNIQSSYVESTSATLAVSLAGLSPGTGFGKIQFTAAPNFAGKFAVDTLNGYHPSSGNSFLVITYPSHTGGFSGYNGLNLGGGLQLSPSLAAAGLTLTAGGATTGIGSISLSGANVVLAVVNGLSGKTNITLTSTNVAKPLNQWTPIATNVLNANGNFTLTITNAVTPGVRQKFFILQLP